MQAIGDFEQDLDDQAVEDIDADDDSEEELDEIDENHVGYVLGPNGYTSTLVNVPPPLASHVMLLLLLLMLR
jgi:hypothetical protein